MVRVDNKKMIQSLTKRFMKSYKKNTITMLLAITLIVTAAVGLLTLFHTNHWIEALQNQFIYTNIDCQISGLTGEQAEMLKKNPQIKNLGIKRYKAAIRTEYQNANLISANEDSVLAVSALTEGTMPKAENEITAEKWALLNLGINPVIGTEVTFDTIEEGSENETPVTYKIVGIIHDIALNKSSGSLDLYTGLGELSDNKKDYFAEIKFKDSVNIQKEISDIQKEFGIGDKAISKNPWQENKKELLVTDIKFGILLCVICFVIVWGIYRISLMEREHQYGILRAVGVTNKQIRTMIVSELIRLYVYSIPFGLLFGSIVSEIITYLSENRETEIYFWGERQLFEIKFPLLPIACCIMGIGFVLAVVAWLGSRKVNGQTIISSITGATENQTTKIFTAENKKKNARLHSAKRNESVRLMHKLGLKYIFCEFRTSCMIVLSFTIGASLFFSLAYKAILSSAETKIKTEGNFYNSDYMLSANDDRSALKGISEETLKKAKEIPEIAGAETQKAMPVKAVNGGTKKSEPYFKDREKRVKNIYGFPLQNLSGNETVYHTKLKGYNTEALKGLKKYLAEGDFNPEQLNENEVILAMPRMSEYGKSKGTVGFFKRGKPVMEYHAGDNITIKYRSDFDTTSDEYWNGTDRGAEYATKDLKIAAIAYYPYMKQVSVIEQVYPLLITDEKNYNRINFRGAYETINFSLKNKVGKEREKEIERALIQLSVENQQVTARSLIPEKEKLMMMYRKELVYIYGIAFAAFVLILINIVNSLKYRMQTRKRELYLYRALGMDFQFQSKMIRFENMIFAAVSLAFTFFISHGLSRFLYAESGIYVYGLSYRYHYTVFGVLAVFTVLLTVLVSKILCSRMKNENIITELHKIE